MKDMFYNYDNDVMVDNVFRLPLEIPPKDLEFANRPFVIRNVKGDAVGVEGKTNSLFKLFFHLACNKDNATLAELLARGEFHFELLNRRYQVVATFPVEAYLDDLSLGVDIWTIDELPEEEEDEDEEDGDNTEPDDSSDNNEALGASVVRMFPITPGIYKMKLYIISEGFKYMVFSENDGILSIK